MNKKIIYITLLISIFLILSGIILTRIIGNLNNRDTIVVVESKLENANETQNVALETNMPTQTPKLDKQIQAIIPANKDGIYYIKINTQMNTITIYTKEKKDVSYIQNEIGEKFECTMSPSRNAKIHFLDGNEFDFYETFSLTKYDATDKIKAVLYYYGTPVTIEFEKVK